MKLFNKLYKQIFFRRSCVPPTQGNPTISDSKRTLPGTGNFAYLKVTKANFRSIILMELFVYPTALTSLKSTNLNHWFDKHVKNTHCAYHVTLMNKSRDTFVTWHAVYHVTFAVYHSAKITNNFIWNPIEQRYTAQLKLCPFFIVTSDSLALKISTN